MKQYHLSRLRTALTGLGILALVMNLGSRPARADGPTVPAGFKIAAVSTEVHHPTRLAFGPDGRLYVTQQTGEIMAIRLENGQEVARQQVGTAKMNVLGLTFKGDDLYISDPGTVSVYHRAADGTYPKRQELVHGLPNGRHQTDALAFGPDGKLYISQGSTTDKGPETDARAGAILRMNADGSGLEVYAHGLRNPYGMVFTPEGELWVTDNGQDDPPSEDELNHIVHGGDYGWPKVLGMPPASSKTVAPVTLMGEHNSTDGLTYYSGTAFPTGYQGGFFVAEWGSSFDDNVGRAVGFVRVKKTATGEVGEHEPFATGFNRPLDVLMGPAGDLWVADFYANTIYRIWFDGPRRAGPTPGTPAAPTPTPPSTPPAAATPPTTTSPAPPPRASHRGAQVAYAVGGAAVAAGTLGILWLLLRRRR